MKVENTKQIKPELLAPAGSLEKLKIAIEYGADAVYMGGKDYGLRAFASNFDKDQMQEGINYAHSKGKKVYVTVNVIPHNEDLEGLPGYLEELYNMGVDAVIVSDPGVISIAKKVVPNLELHLSTQANCTNWKSALFWKEIGLTRIIMARELSLDEIEEVKEKSGVDVETFVHGAMCISYSGRCLLSAYMLNRNANRGTCAHPCRWKYSLMEEMRPGEYFPVGEDERGTYVLSSKDLCMLEYIPDLINAGIKAFKIEGRMRSIHYVATVTRAYRLTIDNYLNDPSNYELDKNLIEEVNKASTRPFTTGFYFSSPDEEDQIYDDEYKEKLTYNKFVGIAIEEKEIDGKKYLIVEQRNRFEVGDTLELIEPKNYLGKIKVEEIINSEGNKVESAPHPKERIMIPISFSVKENALIRKVG
ncbi:peptidase U32 family protein [Natranaerofaba carboxydovora]|uniref:peptidase U32 family protein n=1 Tax=Natranaerofaba carboxydovora TaxID=2742683 RepID=UPI001F12FAD3|nr:U32 family peptidase [Natranaerofaba carboxydovora]UMZ74003.1 putative protease YdcP [Natranaerofaba carboxydovora]